MLNENTLSNQIMMAPQPYKSGGKVSRKMIAAHMAPHELDILDHLQGGKEIDRKSGARAYSHFEHLLGNPHLRSAIMHTAKKKFAEGGAVEHIARAHEDISEDPEKDKLQRLLDLVLAKKAMRPQDLTREEMEFLAANGEHGDREMALLGPRTHHAFDQLAGHRTKNPKTGLPEYFELSSVLSGLWDVIKGAGGHLAGGLAEGLAHSGSRFLEEKTGGHPLAQLAGKFARGASRYLGDKFRGAGASSPYAERMGGIGARMMDDPEGAYADARDMAGGLGHKFAGMGRQFARYGMGRARDYMQQGMDAAGGFADGGFRHFGQKFAGWQQPRQQPSYAAPFEGGGAQQQEQGLPALPAMSSADRKRAAYAHRLGQTSATSDPVQQMTRANLLHHTQRGMGPQPAEAGALVPVAPQQNSRYRSLRAAAMSGQGVRPRMPIRNTFAEQQARMAMPSGHHGGPRVMPAVMPGEEEQEQPLVPVNF